MQMHTSGHPRAHAHTPALLHLTVPALSPFSPSSPPLSLFALRLSRQLLSDVQLVWSNCRQYIASGAHPGAMADMAAAVDDAETTFVDLCLLADLPLDPQQQQQLQQQQLPHGGQLPQQLQVQAGDASAQPAKRAPPAMGGPAGATAATATTTTGRQQQQRHSVPPTTPAAAATSSVATAAISTAAAPAAAAAGAATVQVSSQQVGTQPGVPVSTGGGVPPSVSQSATAVAATAAGAHPQRAAGGGGGRVGELAQWWAAALRAVKQLLREEPSRPFAHPVTEEEAPG